LAELGRELGEQLLHRAPHDFLVHGLVLLPVGLRVVGLEALVELDRFSGPPSERHDSSHRRRRKLRLCGDGRQSRRRRGRLARETVEDRASAWREPVAHLKALGETELLHLAHVALERLRLLAHACREAAASHPCTITYSL